MASPEHLPEPVPQRILCLHPGLQQDGGLPRERSPWLVASGAEGTLTPVVPGTTAGTGFGCSAPFALKIPALKCKKCPAAMGDIATGSL